MSLETPVLLRRPHRAVARMFVPCDGPSPDRSNHAELVDPRRCWSASYPIGVERQTLAAIFSSLADFD